MTHRVIDEFGFEFEGRRYKSQTFIHTNGRAAVEIYRVQKNGLETFVGYESTLHFTGPLAPDYLRTARNVSFYRARKAA